ncbi:hypothetical protein V8E55_007441 [Tylopilus felleus]
MFSKLSSLALFTHLIWLDGSYPEDRRRMKIFVAIMWALDTIHEALTVAGVYKYIMGGLMNPLSLLADILEFIVIPAMFQIGEMMLEIFKGFESDGAKVFYSVNGMQFARICLPLASRSVHIVSLTEISDPFFMCITLLNLVVGAVVDALIAIAMTILLFCQWTTTGFVGSNTRQILQICYCSSFPESDSKGKGLATPSLDTGICDSKDY